MKKAPGFLPQQKSFTITKILWASIGEHCYGN